MKKSVLFITFILMLSISSNILAQDMFTVLDGNLNSDEEKIVKSAEKSIKDGDQMFSTANNEYNKYEDLFNSGKKGKIKKAEKKTVKAKKNLSTAATYYDIGYEKLYNLYLEKLQGYEIEDNEDKQQVSNLMSEAESSFNAGQKTLSNHKSYTEKELKKTVKYKSLRGSIEQGGNKQKEAVGYLVDAIVIYLGQGAKKQQKIDDDNQAWTDAQRLNTIPSYKSYLNNFPDGLHASHANSKISSLEDEAERIANQKTNIIFRIQILASKKPLSQYQQDMKRPAGYGDVIYTNTVESDSHPYKYLIGEYTSYEAARSAERGYSTKETRYFIVAFEDNERVSNIRTVCDPDDHPTADPIR